MGLQGTPSPPTQALNRDPDPSSTVRSLHREERRESGSGVSFSAWKALWDGFQVKMKRAEERVLAPREAIIQEEQGWHQSSRKELLDMLLSECPTEFLRKHRLNGPAHLVLQRNNREMLEKAYSAWLAEAFSTLSTLSGLIHADLPVLVCPHLAR